MSLVIVVILRVKVACRNSTLPKITAMAVVRPASAKLVAVAAGRPTSYTTLGDTTDQAMPAYRHPQLAANYLAFIKLASIRLWLRTYVSAP